MSLLRSLADGLRSLFRRELVVAGASGIRAARISSLFIPFSPKGRVTQDRSNLSYRGCKVEGCPCRMDFSRAECLLTSPPPVSCTVSVSSVGSQAQDYPSAGESQGPRHGQTKIADDKKHLCKTSGSATPQDVRVIRCSG